MNNTVILVGRLVKDIELRYTTSGIAVCNFTLAVTNNYKNKETGEYDAEFIDIEAWRDTAKLLSKYCQKGDMIGVKGTIAKKSYEDKEGKKRYETYVKAENVMFMANSKKEEPKEKLNCVETMEAVTKDPFEEFANETQNTDLPF